MAGTPAEPAPPATPPSPGDGGAPPEASDATGPGPGSQGPAGNGDAEGAGPPPSPWSTPRQVLVRFGTVVALIAADLWSKARVFAWLEGRPAGMEYDRHGHFRYPLVGEHVTFMRSLNPGAAFGQLDQFPYLLVLGRCGAVLFLTWMLLRTPREAKRMVAALVLILAGAMGNLYDNLFLESEGHPFGKVRDFIDVYFARWDWHFPTFNVADSCITVGAVLLLSSLLGGRDEGARGGSEPVARAPHLQ